MNESGDGREMGENRRFTRVILSRSARLTINGQVHPREKVHDLSLGGMFVEGAYQARPGDPCQVEFFEEGRRSCLVLRMEARVVRCEAGGLALEFVDMPEDSYRFLQTMVLYASDDPLGVSKEFLEDFPGPLSPVRGRG